MILPGLRVVDLTGGLAGAYAAKLLTDLGADVVKVEPPGGHPLRRHDADGALFAYLATSQRSIGVADRGEVAGWLAGADVALVDDPPPVTLPGGYSEWLAAARPGGGGAVTADVPAVTVELSAVGHGGPDDGLDLPEEVLQARSGSLSNHGHADRTPLTVGGHLGEHVTGAFAALGAVTAWGRARRSGVAEHVDVSMLEAMQLTLVTVPTLMSRFPGGRPRTFRWVMIPGNEPTRDGYAGITTVTAAQWRSLLAAIGRDDLVDDEELATMLGRFVRRDEVEPMLHAWTTARTSEEVVDACVAARVPAAVVGNGEVLPKVAHLRTRAVFVRQPGERWIRPRAPFRFHGVVDRRLEPAPGGPDPGLRPWPAREERSGGRLRRGPPGRGSSARFESGDRPLAGVRVVDFTAFWAGPFATAWLASMGAEVIKVESVRRPDGIRFSAAVRPADDPAFYEKSALFHAVNLGKRGITLDLGHPDGLEWCRRLLATADVVAENFTPRVLEGFGLGYEGVRELRPDVVMLRMPAFGLTGPWRDRGGFAQTMEQLTGLAWLTGYEGGPPIIPGGVVDPMVGTHAALAVVAALERRRDTGEGGLVEVPLVEVAAAVTAEQVIRCSATGELMGRRGEGGVYACRGDDAWVAVDRATDPLEPAERAEWCASLDAEAAAARLREEGVPAAAMAPAHVALDDVQLQARGFFERVANPLVGDQDYPSWPLRLSGGPERYWSGPAPTLGRDTEEVLRELGADEAVLAHLAAEHVTGTVPRPG